MGSHDKKSEKDKNDSDEEEIEVRPSSPPSIHNNNIPLLPTVLPPSQPDYARETEVMYDSSQMEQKITNAKLRTANVKGRISVEEEEVGIARAGRERNAIHYHTNAAIRAGNRNASKKVTSRDEGLTVHLEHGGLGLAREAAEEGKSGEEEVNPYINPYKYSTGQKGYEVAEYDVREYETTEYQTKEYKSV